MSAPDPPPPNQPPPGQLLVEALVLAFVGYLAVKYGALAMLVTFVTLVASCVAH